MWYMYCSYWSDHDSENAVSLSPSVISMNFRCTVTNSSWEVHVKGDFFLSILKVEVVILSYVDKPRK